MPLKNVVDGILDKHEECEAKKEEERVRKAEERKFKRELTAKTIQEFLLTTVKPVFDEAETLLSGRGYKVEVTTSAKKDHSGEREKEFVLEVTLATCKKGYSTYPDNKLSYKGSFDEEAIVIETLFPNERPTKKKPVLISQIELAIIERGVESFLGKFFVC